MKNKKIIAILTILFLSLSLCGCNGKVDVSQESSSEFDTSEETEEETEESESSEEETETTKEEETTKESENKIEESKTEESKEEKKETETKESNTSESSKQSTPKQEETKQAETTPTPHTHNYSNSVIIENATCNKDGSKQLSCSCGDTRIEIIPATGQHTWEPQYGTVQHEAKGEMRQVQIGTSESTYECGYCGSTFSTIAALDDHRANSGDRDHAFCSYWVHDGGPIYENQYVILEEAWTENVITGYICTTCGISQ